MAPARTRCFRVAATAIVLCVAFFCGLASAQEWPVRAVTMVVPYAAGGPVDTVGRIIAARLSEVLRQQVVIENYGGSGGMLGAAKVAKAAPDGYTMLLGGTAVLAQVPALYKKPLYDPVADFTPVAMFADSARVLIVRKDLPVASFKEFIAYTRANQAKMQFGSAGAGSGLHVCAVLMNGAIGVDVTHVPYRGSSMAIRDLIGGRLDYMCEQISTAVPQIQSGAVRPIVMLGPARNAALPEVQTTKEHGFEDLDCGSWSAFVFPKGVPDAIVRRLAQATSEAVDTPAVRERFAAVGVTVVPAAERSPEFLARHVPRELARWTKPIRASGASAD